MCEQSSEWLCSWERDAQGRKLSVIVNLDTYIPLAAGRECDLLRPVFIDGPSIGEVYDEEYRLKNHKGQHSQQNAASWPLHKFRPFPVMALCQTLFTFIARGHKTVALLPGIYDERTPDGMFGNDVSHVVDNVRMLRKLVKMHLVQFKKDFTNFEVSVRIKAQKANGALVTGHFIPDLDKPKKSAEEGRRSANESKKNKKQPSLGPSSEIKNYHTTFLHSLPPNYVPIIKPFFFTMRKERRMSVPLDSPCFQGVLPTVGELLVFPTKVDSDQAVSELAKHWQLTLFAQYRLLEELNALLNGHYPGGNREKNVWQMVKELWEESREVRREAEDPLHELEDRAIFNGDIGEVRTSLLALSIYD